MKTQKKQSLNVVKTAMLLLTLLVMVACGGNQSNTPVQKDSSNDSETPVQPPGTDIHTATFLGDLKAIQQHIKAESDLDVKEPSMGSSPLISAAVFGKTDVARALIEGGADVNLQNNEGSTALHSAAFLCRLEIVEMLLENGANKNLLNNYGSTALESVAGPFADVKFIFDQFSRDLGPLGFKLDYEFVEVTRPKIAAMLR
jgi:hypothetical protein